MLISYNNVCIIVYSTSREVSAKSPFKLVSIGEKGTWGLDGWDLMCHINEEIHNISTFSIHMLTFETSNVA